ncbi:MAG: hypothetical protein H6550_16005 [Chitinophagales bacterium]|nr:hypothetical protein [Chitinophagales bacterium]
MREPRDKNNYEKVDYTIPVKTDKVMAYDQKKFGDTCFGKEWAPNERLCAMCHDIDICGMVFHANVKKLVAKVEESEPAPFLDKTDLDGVDRNAVIIWIQTKPRKFSEMVDYVYAMAGCSDKETVRYWCKSFVLDNDHLTAEKGTIYFKK